MITTLFPRFAARLIFSVKEKGYFVVLGVSPPYFLPPSPMRQSLSLAIIGTMLLGSATAFAEDVSFSQKPFTDVPEGSTYYEGIEYLRTHNVLKGYLDGTFKPNARINRAEFMKFVVNPLILDTNNLSECIRANVPENSKIVFFRDVALDAWYAPEVCFGKMKAIVDGYPNGTFQPAESINFVEAAKIINNVFSLGLEEETTGEFWYRPYVQRLSELKAIPTSVKRFDQILTRGEMAEMVYRLKADREDKPSTNMSSMR